MRKATKKAAPKKASGVKSVNVDLPEDLLPEVQQLHDRVKHCVCSIETEHFHQTAVRHLHEAAKFLALVKTV